MAAVYSRKRTHCSSATGETAVQSKHKIGYNASRKTDFPWHIPVFDDTETNIIDLLSLLANNMVQLREIAQERGRTSRVLPSGEMHYNATKSLKCIRHHKNEKLQGYSF